MISDNSGDKPQRSPILAFFLALIPGLGQIYAGRTGRGVAILLMIPSLILLTLWRMSVGGINYSGPITQAPSETQVRAAWLMGSVLLIITFLIYVWSIWDATSIARGRPLSVSRMILLACLATFIIGWDVTEINTEKVMTRFSEIVPRLGQLAWPWDQAFVQGVEQTQASQFIDVPCVPDLAAQPEQVSGAPSIQVTPLCGEMAGSIQPDGSRNPPGTVMHITGQGFRPNEPVTAWWSPPDGGEFRPRAGGDPVVQTDSNGAFTMDVTIPTFTIANGLPHATAKLMLRQEQGSGPLRPSSSLTLALSKMTETIFLGLMATFFGIVLAFPLSFLAAKNLMSRHRFTYAIYWVIRGVFNIVRSIEPLIWAVIFISWVGLGPFAGTLALAFHTIASLGKLYSEAIENIESGPLEAIQATGANWLQVIVYGVVPQVIPPFVSFTVYRWDINVRASTLIGMVGGGGIGALLIQWIRLSDYDSAGIAVWLIAIVVFVLDYASARIREEFV